jgi:hypothetical protein
MLIESLIERVQISKRNGMNVRDQRAEPLRQTGSIRERQRAQRSPVIVAMTDDESLTAGGRARDPDRSVNDFRSRAGKQDAREATRCEFGKVVRERRRKVVESVNQCGAPP